MIKSLFGFFTGGSLMLKLAPIIAIVVAGLMAGAYFKGRSDARVATLKATVEAYKKREDIDNEVRDLSHYDLCVRLGGLPDECAELRGVEETTEAE